MTDGIDFVPLVSGKSSSLNVRNPRSWLQRPPSEKVGPLSHDNLGSPVSKLVDCSFGLLETVIRCVA